MKKWIVTCNLSQYNVFNAFEQDATFYWPQSVNMKKGDIVYIYVAHPYHRLRFETKIIEVNISVVDAIDDAIIIDPTHFEASQPYMLLEVVMMFDDPRFHYKSLEANGLNTVRRPSIVQEQVANYIKGIQMELIQEHEQLLDKQYIDNVNKSICQQQKDIDQYEPYPINAPGKLWLNGRLVYPRNHQYAIRALQLANYQCEIDKKHPTFYRKDHHLLYTEPHHLIPMSKQKQFLFSLDVEANIVSLCSCCHAAIHHGQERTELVQQLYEQRKNQLKKAGIGIGLAELLKMYR